MIIDEIRLKYDNAKAWFLRNYDNPKERDRALRNYTEVADTLYFFENGETIREKNLNATIVERCRELGGLGV